MFSNVYSQIFKRIENKNFDNKNIKISSFESDENTERQSVGHIVQFRIMNPHQWPLINLQ